MTYPAQRTFECMLYENIQGYILLTFEYNSKIYSVYISKYSHAESSYTEYFEITIANMNIDGTDFQKINTFTLIDSLTNASFYDGNIYFLQDTYQEDLSLVKYSLTTNNLTTIFLGESLRWYGGTIDDDSYTFWHTLHVDSNGVHIGWFYYHQLATYSIKRELWYAKCSTSGGEYVKYHVTANFTWITETTTYYNRTDGFSGAIERMKFIPTPNGLLYVWRDNSNYSYNSGYISYCTSSFTGTNTVIRRSTLHTYTLNPQYIYTDGTNCYCIFDGFQSTYSKYIFQYDSSGLEVVKRGFSGYAGFQFSELLVYNNELYCMFWDNNTVKYVKYDSSFSTYTEHVDFGMQYSYNTIDNMKFAFVDNEIKSFMSATNKSNICLYIWSYPGTFVPITANTQVSERLISANTNQYIQNYIYI